MIKGSGSHKREAPNKSTPLHDAAFQGNLKLVKQLLRTSKHDLYTQDEGGLTPLHYAAMKGHLDVVKALSPQAEAFFILDNDGFLPISYASQFPEVVDYLRSNGSLPSLCTDIHFAAMNNDTALIAKIIKDNPEKLDARDLSGNTPLAYAFERGKKEAAELLVSLGADLETLNAVQLDLVQKAKKTSLYHYAKALCGLPQSHLDLFKSTFETMLKEEIAISRTQNKQLLIILGETHFVYKILQVEAIMLQIAKDNGISVLLSEYPHGTEEENYPTDKYARETLGMMVRGIDNHPFETLEERNSMMIQEIFGCDQSAVVRIGSEHLQGILEMPDTAFREKYHVLPINLSSLLKKKLNNAEALFAANSNLVVQLVNDGFSSCTKPRERWNTRSVPLFAPVQRSIQVLTPRHAAASRPAQSMPAKKIQKRQSKKIKKGP